LLIFNFGENDMKLKKVTGKTAKVFLFLLCFTTGNFASAAGSPFLEAMGMLLGFANDTDQLTSQLEGLGEDGSIKKLISGNTLADLRRRSAEMDKYQIPDLIVDANEFKSSLIAMAGVGCEEGALSLATSAQKINLKLAEIESFRVVEESLKSAADKYRARELAVADAAEVFRIANDMLVGGVIDVLTGGKLAETADILENDLGPLMSELSDKSRQLHKKARISLQAAEKDMKDFEKIARLMREQADSMLRISAVQCAFESNGGPTMPASEIEKIHREIVTATDLAIVQTNQTIAQAEKMREERMAAAQNEQLYTFLKALVKASAVGAELVNGADVPAAGAGTTKAGPVSGPAKSGSAAGPVKAPSSPSAPAPSVKPKAAPPKAIPKKISIPSKKTKMVYEIEVQQQEPVQLTPQL
jgi:hypothetical protein